MNRENDEYIAAKCTAWVRWLKSRRFYNDSFASSSTTLGRLASPASGPDREMDGRNDPELQFFNLAVHTCLDMDKYREAGAAFKDYYLVEKRIVAKRAASDLGVSRRTYYNHIKKFARAVNEMAGSLKKAHDVMWSMTARQAAA